MGHESPELYQSEVRTWGTLLGPGYAAQRFAWWQRVWRAADGAIPDYHRRYGEELERFRRDTETPEYEIASFHSVNNRLVTWAER
jgi:hypothetical protein